MTFEMDYRSLSRRLRVKDLTRRDLVKASAGVVAGLAAAAAMPGRLAAAVHTASRGRPAARLRFGVVGINHSHIYAMVDATIRGGGELVSFHALEPDLRSAFGA